MDVLRRSFAALVVFMTFSVAGAEADLKGIWQIRGNNDGLLAAAVTPPAFTPEGQKRYEQNRAAVARRDASVDTAQRCASPGTPRLMLLPYPFEILQQPDHIVMLFTWNQLFRQIPINGERGPYTLPSAVGFSSGRWQGDTLVVTTTDRTGKTLLDNSGLPNGDRLKTTERLRLKSGGKVLENRITIDDPQNYVQPWEAVVEFDRLRNATLQEDVCLDRMAAGRPPIETPAERRKAASKQ